MSKARDKDGLQFLSVAMAAERLGLSRLRMRELAALGLIPSQRDNEGRLRLDLSAQKGRKAPKAKDKRPDAGALMDLLFDEVEELQAELAARDCEITALRDLVVRQDMALERAGRTLDVTEAHAQCLSELLDRTFARLEDEVGAKTRLAEVSGATMDRLEDVGQRLEKSVSQTERYEALLTRALQLAEAGDEAHATEARALGVAADRAMCLLDAALGEAEAAHLATDRSGALLDRALAAGEKLERDVAARDTTIESQKGQLDTALAMSERAVALATPADAVAPRKGFWRRLLGI